MVNVFCEGWFKKSLVGLGKVRGTGAKGSGPESVLAPNISPQTPTRERPQFLSLCPFFKPTSSLLLLHLTLSSLLDPSAVMITGLAPFLSSIPRKLLFLSSLCIRCLLFQFYMLMFFSISAAFSNSERCGACNLGFVLER